MRCAMFTVALVATLALVRGQTISGLDKCYDIGLSFCSECENPPMRCYECADTSVLMADKSGCKDCDTANCKTCTWAANGVDTECQECLSEFTLKDAACDACGTNCLSCEYDTAGVQSCSECFSTTVLSNLDNANCLSCGSNCLSCTADADDAITCSQCASGYLNNGGKCEACPTNCISCALNGNTKECSTCNTGYEVSTDKSKCLPCNGGCVTCSAEDAPGDSTRALCSTCEDDYYLDDASGLCVVCLSNCASCSEAAVCDSCDEGYYLDTSGSACIACDWKCKTCTAVDTCSECFDGYTTKLITSLTCDPCPLYCTSCTTEQAADGQCTTCDSGYYRDSSTLTCKKCSSNCDSCTSSTSCTTCATGYNKADDNACYKCTDNCLDDQTSCSYNTTASQASCTACALGYAPKEDTTCEPCGTGCVGYCTYNVTSSSAECTCSDGSAADNTNSANAFFTRGFCSATSDYACEAGYYYDETANNGMPGCTTCAISGCVHCNSTDAITCLDCDTSAGYASTPKDDGTCYACSSFDSKCEACTFTVSNAVYTGTCQTCASGYSVYEGGCRACGVLCDSCTFTTSGTTVTSSCSTCKSASVQDPDNDSNCRACTSPCTSCSADGTSTLCDTCPSLYALATDGTCNACPENCLVCEYDANSALICTDSQCATGYGKKTDGLCYECPYDCASCSVDATLGDDVLYCDTCDSKFTRNDKLCAPCPSNCDTCEEASGSVSGTAADTYYYLDSEGLCPKCTANCQKCSSTSCSTCDDGYGLSSDKKSCTACATLTKVDNCALCDDASSDGNATCTDCNSGYVLSDDNSFCNQTSLLGTKCTSPEDHTPECLTCDVTTDRYLAMDEDENDFEYPKECAFECYSCGEVDEEGTVVTAGTPEECNPKKDGNFTDTDYCYDGFCAVFVQIVDGVQSVAARGCMKNATCPEKTKEQRSCVGPDKQNQFCAQCCIGDLCNDYYYSASGSVYASLALILSALTAALRM